MAVLANTHPTLLDLKRRMDPNDKIARIIELLHQEDDIIEDMVWIEGNLPTGHRTTIRTGLPIPTWRKLYGGVQPTKSTTAQITDSCGMLEAYAEVDKALADLNGNTAEFRLSEDRAHIEGIRQELQSTTFFGNETTEPEAFTGLGARFNSTTAANGENVLKAGGSNAATTTSIWLACWGPNTGHAIYPKGSTVGLQMQDKGQVTIENATDGVGGTVGGGRFEAYRTHYRWDCGLTIRDWRYFVRIANIDTALLNSTFSGSSADLTDLMARATELLPNRSMGRCVWYMNRTVRSFLRRQLAEKVKASTLTMESVGGRPVMMFDEIPVRRADALLIGEGLVV